MQIQLIGVELAALTCVVFLWMALYHSETYIVRTPWSAWRRRALSRIANLGWCSIDLRCGGLFSPIRSGMKVRTSLRPALVIPVTIAPAMGPRPKLDRMLFMAADG